MDGSEPSDLGGYVQDNHILPVQSYEVFLHHISVRLHKYSGYDLALPASVAVENKPVRFFDAGLKRDRGSRGLLAEVIYRSGLLDSKSLLEKREEAHRSCLRWLRVSRVAGLISTLIYRRRMAWASSGRPEPEAPCSLPG